MTSEMTRTRLFDPDETGELPQHMYLACRPDNSGVMLEIRTCQREPVVLAYSSLDRFLEGCGSDQPWIYMSSQRVAEVACTKEVSALNLAKFQFAILLDTPVPPELRGTAGGFAEEERRWDDEDSEDWQMVYLASRPFEPGDERALLELQPLPGQHLAIMAYSSVAALEAACGPKQAWFRTPAGLLSEARRQSGADTICLDTPLPNHVRHGYCEESDE